MVNMYLKKGKVMNRYTKFINMMGSYYTKDFEKEKKNIIKVREVKEETVRKFFLQGDCEILVDDFSSEEDIKKYLGSSFIQKRRK